MKGGIRLVKLIELRTEVRIRVELGYDERIEWQGQSLPSEKSGPVEVPYTTGTYRSVSRDETRVLIFLVVGIVGVSRYVSLILDLTFVLGLVAVEGFLDVVGLGGLVRIRRTRRLGLKVVRRISQEPNALR